MRSFAFLFAKNVRAKPSIDDVVLIRPLLLFQVINIITNDNTSCEDSGIRFKIITYS